MGTDPRAQEAPSTGKGIQGGAEAEGGTESSKDVKQGGQEAQLATSEVAKAGMGATTDGAAYLAALPHHQNGHHQNGHHLQENGHYHPLQQASEGAGEQIGGSEQLPLHIEGGVLVPPGGHRAEQEGHLPPPHACINVDALPAQPLPLPVSFGSANSSWGQPLQQLEGQAPSGVMGDSWQGSSIHHQSLGQAGSQGGEQQQEVGVHEHEGGTQGLDSSDQWYGYLLGPVEGHDAGLLSLQQAQADESFQEAGRVTSEEMGHDKSFGLPTGTDFMGCAQGYCLAMLKVSSAKQCACSGFPEPCKPGCCLASMHAAFWLALIFFVSSPASWLLLEDEEYSSAPERKRKGKLRRQRKPSLHHPYICFLIFRLLYM
eukprot:1150120-Pelagomonas_calceolata.AAC.1